MASSMFIPAPAMIARWIAGVGGAAVANTSATAAPGYGGTGVSGVYTGGTTGEFYALDDTEKRTVVAEALLVGQPLVQASQWVLYTPALMPCMVSVVPNRPSS